jgi:uncharacterized protein YndB with AHSA1/START domain
VLTRVFNAPRARVFRAWIDPQQLARWWGPKGFTAPRCEVDARPGGAVFILMRGPDGTEIPVTAVLDELVEPERIVLTTTGFEDADGVPQIEVRHTVTLVEHDGKTTLTLLADVIKASPAMAEGLAGMDASWRQSLDKLAGQVATA